MPAALAKQWCDQVDAGAVAVPARQTTQRSLIKVDTCMMMWCRRELERTKANPNMRVARFLVTDSSPQGGYDYF
eukprot:12514849-Alexandrium_andersonii.AAC.1